MASVKQPLGIQFPIVNPDGTPTLYFIQWAQGQQIDISEGITAAQAQQLINDWAAQRDIIAGTALSGGGNLSSDVTIDFSGGVPDLNDVDLSTPPTDGQVLVYDLASGKWVPADQSGGGGGGGMPWVVAYTTTITIATPDIIIPDLGGYDELLISVKDVTASVASSRSVQFSTDNGVTFFNTSGNYLEYATAGSPTSVAQIALHGTGSTAARSGSAHLIGNVVSDFKTIHRVNVDASAPLTYFVGSTAAINAVRLFNLTGGNLTGGTVLILGRKASSGTTGVPFETTAIGTGVSQNVTLPVDGLTVESVLVFVNGIRYPTVEYSISGTVLTLTTNASGDNIAITGFIP